MKRLNQVPFIESFKCCTLKQVGHMVMLTSGNRERKYSHLSGLGQRLIRTSLLLIERSTERLTLTGTKFEPPCCWAHRHIHNVLWTLSFCLTQLVKLFARILNTFLQSFLTSKLIFAVNGSSSASLKPSSILQAWGSNVFWLRTNELHGYIVLYLYLHVLYVLRNSTLIYKCTCKSILRLKRFKMISNQFLRVSQTWVCKNRAGLSALEYLWANAG